MGAEVTQISEVGTSANRSANPQIVNSRFYLQICELNFLPQIFADLRWKNWKLPQIRKAIDSVASSAVKSVWEVDDLIT